MHHYPQKITNSVEFIDDDLITYAEFAARPHADKVGTYWDVKDACVVNIKSTIKAHYILEQDYTCCYCKQKIIVKHKGAWDAEHIIPKSKHPAFIFEPKNLAISCKDCNGAKLDQEVLVNSQANHRVNFLEKSEDYIIVHPHIDDYDEHIEIRDNFLIYRGRTDKGVKTIVLCGLLRFGKDTNYSNVSATNIDEVTDSVSKVSNANNVDEQYAALLELEHKVRMAIAKVYDIRSRKVRV